jgi:hypothetical protein
MYRSLRAGAVTLGLLLAAPAMAQPQTSAAVTATLTVPTVLHIEVNSSVVNFTADDAAMQAGFAAGDQQTTVTHRGNVQHTVSVAADAALFTGTGGGGGADPVRTDKPAADLSWSLDGTTFTPFSTTAAVVHGAAPRGAHVNDDDVSYRVALSYADTPGTYTLDLTYTVAAD